MDDLDTRINIANEMMVTEADIETAAEPQKLDVFESERYKLQDTDMRKAHGAKPKAKLDLSALEDTLLRQRYHKAKDDCDYYNSIGNKQYASMIKQQYMQDVFLPVVDALVRLNGVGAVLSNKALLDKLDHQTLLDGTSGSGYTRTYLTKLYRPEGQLEASDGQIRQGMHDIKYLCEMDQISAAVGKANMLKQKIDSGENIASSEDYEIIQKIALYGQ